ncbi:hypothetical protein [Opitutus terrae]|uniref:Uncharacterized protein n=1 Tax=Opitutus terrae (strain DSM 11246 / JCM 15787 / PB90-1) TaxID=452637 RepID=B1ZTZ4_OPITP|nr:hypothetical protein [Opitutus terrae]ACB75876.1 hypothetical protein Oter_2594 [Opitutus terrae PB90-1]
MIFVYQDDGSLCAMESVAQANRHYEAIDVENAEYTFLDDSGRVLKPVFRAPTKKKWLFFFSITDPGPFTLEPTDERREDLLGRLRSGEIPIDRGPTSVRTLDELRQAAPQLFSP